MDGRQIEDLMAMAGICVYGDRSPAIALAGREILMNLIDSRLIEQVALMALVAGLSALLAIGARTLFALGPLGDGIGGRRE